MHRPAAYGPGIRTSGAALHCRSEGPRGHTERGNVAENMTVWRSGRMLPLMRVTCATLPGQALAFGLQLDCCPTSCAASTGAHARSCR